MTNPFDAATPMRRSPPHLAAAHRRRQRRVRGAGLGRDRGRLRRRALRGHSLPQLVEPGQLGDRVPHARQLPRLLARRPRRIREEAIRRSDQPRSRLRAHAARPHRHRRRPRPVSQEVFRRPEARRRHDAHRHAADALPVAPPAAATWKIVGFLGFLPLEASNADDVAHEIAGKHLINGTWIGGGDGGSSTRSRPRRAPRSARSSPRPARREVNLAAARGRVGVRSVARPPAALAGGPARRDRREDHGSRQRAARARPRPRRRCRAAGSRSSAAAPPTS